VELTSDEDKLIKKADSVFEEIEKKEKAAKEDKTQAYKSDNQLSRAVDVLKALKIYQK
jgi:hypothetical protein